VPGSSSLSSAAATRRALAARLSAAISAGAVAGVGPAPAAVAAAISETRILTPKDFSRIRKLQAALAEKGITRPTPADILALLGSGGGTTVAGSARGGATEEEEAGARAWQAHQLRKRRRKAGRGLGIAPEEGAAEGEEAADGGVGGEEEEEHQLAMPGTSFAPPVVSFDPLEIEAMETSRKRRQAGALMDAIKVGGGFFSFPRARMFLSATPHPHPPTPPTPPFSAGKADEKVRGQKGGWRHYQQGEGAAQELSHAAQELRGAGEAAALSKGAEQGAYQKDPRRREDGQAEKTAAAAYVNRGWRRVGG
jgi:hypothetical protein